MKYECVCGYVYDEAAGDPENGIEPGTKWDELPDDFACPVCGLGKEEFTKEN
jgi:rubredoxin